MLAEKKKKRKDRFDNFAALERVMEKGKDYRFVLPRDNADPRVLIMAPHGGKIEPHTSLIAKRIANDTFGYYAFEGIRKRNNRDLHITSHKFDEPRAVRFARQSTTILTVHGRRDNGDPSTVYLGGLHNQLVNLLGRELDLEGFASRSYVRDFRGTSVTNICNRGKSGAGAQLELPYTLRQELARNEEALDRFAKAALRAIRHILEIDI